MKTVTAALVGLLLGCALLVGGAYWTVRAALAPLPGEWSLPLRLGPVELEVGVPSLLRLATSRWGGPLMQGLDFETAHGRLSFSWQPDRQTLWVRCRPCSLQPPGLGQDALQLPEVQVSVRRQGEQLAGHVAAGAVRGDWHAELARGGVRLRLDIPATPLADGYALFARHIPELAQARIAGQFSLRAQLSLPGGTLTVAPRIDGFEVAGLGTEAFAGARSSCSRGLPASRLRPDSWLARAVIAAEDRRFDQHTGYDLAELAVSLSRNQQAQRIERGASTLTQQVAKLLVTGGERSPARKLRELLYAVEMERTLGKARILRLYLDNAPWGAQLCGAEAASRRYFGVPARALTPAQAAWLAAMLHNPPAQAQRWADSGEIDLARAQWVALGMRGMSRSRRLALAQDMAQADWTPHWAQPAPREAARDGR